MASFSVDFWLITKKFWLAVVLVTTVFSPGMFLNLEVSANTSNFSGYKLPFPVGYVAQASQSCILSLEPNCQHNGTTNQKFAIDWKCNNWDSIRAVKSGTVVTSFYDDIYTVVIDGFTYSYGNVVKIQHSDGKYSLYAHMSSRSVIEGQQVLQGDEIGKCGSTGAKYTHLHFELRGTASLPTVTAYFDECINNSGCVDGQVNIDVKITSENGYRNESRIKSVVFNNKIYQFARRVGDGILFSRNSSNGTNWSNWEQRTSSKMLGDPAVIVFGGKLYLSIHSTSTSGSLQTQSISTSGVWSSWTSGTTITLRVPPVLTVFNNRLYQTVTGSDNLLYTRSSINGSDWTTWVQGNGITLLEEPAVTVFNGKIYQSGFGTDNKLYIRSSSDGTTWSAWDVGNLSLITIKGKPILQVYNNLLYQYGYGTDNKLYSRTLNTQGTWSNWIYENITLNDEITVLATSNNNLTISAFGSDNKLYTKAQINSVWQEGAGITIKDEVDVVEFNSKIYQTARGTDNAVYVRSANINPTNSNFVWTNWQEFGPRLS